MISFQASAMPPMSTIAEILTSKSSTPEMVFTAVHQIRRLLSRECKSPNDEVHAAGLLPKLVELLDYNDTCCNCLFFIVRLIFYLKMLLCYSMTFTFVERPTRNKFIAREMTTKMNFVSRGVTLV